MSPLGGEGESKSSGSGRGGGLCSPLKLSSLRRMSALLNQKSGLGASFSLSSVVLLSTSCYSFPKIRLSLSYLYLEKKKFSRIL